MLILLDADVVLIDHRYKRDPKYKVNRDDLDRLHRDGQKLGIVTQTLLEIVGVLSFATSISRISGLADLLILQYDLEAIPDPTANTNYASVTIAEVINHLAKQMSLGDAVQAAQISLFAPNADALLTWNAKHFRGKVVVPVLTPEEWLQQQPPPTTPTP